MNRYCSHCGFANAGSAVRCENCKLFVGVSEKEKDVKSFSGIRLMGILVVIGFLTFAGYKTFFKSPPPPPQPTPKWQTDSLEEKRRSEQQQIDERRRRGY
jgi:hypothetical protein